MFEQAHKQFLNIGAKLQIAHAMNRGMRARNVKLEQANKSLSVSHDKMALAVQQHKIEKQELALTLETLTREKDNRIREIMVAKQGQKQVIDTLQTENLKLKQECSEGLQQIDTLQAENLKLKQKCSEGLQQIDTLQAENLKLKQESSKARQKIVLMRDTNGQLRQTKSLLEKQV